jgi:hypothetical protein
MSRCNFGRQNKSWRELFLVHEIGRINGGKVFQNIVNLFQISGNMFYIGKTKFRSKFQQEKGPEPE